MPIGSTTSNAAENSHQPGAVLLKFARNEVHRRRADEARDEPRSRMMIKLLWRADLLDDAMVHHHDPVGQGHGLDLKASGCVLIGATIAQRRARA
jgi:hypothetical protein